MDGESEEIAAVLNAILEESATRGFSQGTTGVCQPQDRGDHAKSAGKCQVCFE